MSQVKTVLQQVQQSVVEVDGLDITLTDFVSTVRTLSLSSFKGFVNALFAESMEALCDYY